jgi:hypothetical protein
MNAEPQTEAPAADPLESAGPPPSVPADAAAVDDRNPWLGLASFTEETREYFYGREEEVAELARRVQRKRLTLLFGQSGLGKTSILRAGLVPRLRGHGYCPVYVRIDYAHDAPEPAEQIKRAIASTAKRSGEWTQVGVAVEGESLWEFLHHRDDVLRDESGTTQVPLLIFDQFEEIFTLAQSDDFGRARAARFIADLADLVENRPPKELEERLEQDETAAERFDFARSDYRVLIALREDYLAPLESLKNAMPSITQNRLRLAPMTGAQALEAVMRPGRDLVSQQVAEAIVRFVAGGSEISNAEVEPALLSLICRELNDARVAQGRGEISLDLVTGSHASILSSFYERCLADQPTEVRRIIEDELLTESGFRENVAEEKLLRSFADAGAAPDTLAVLVNRRLLRIEERLDVRRVELTHDVLCNVVKTSRDVRKEREARDASERLLAEQRERAQAARAELHRARRIAAVCSVLALVAVIAAIFAYVSTQRARRAERRADETRALAEQARNQAEQLLGYLTDDFSVELEAFGRIDVVADLAKREVDYFSALPAGLNGPDTLRNSALAMAHYGAAERRLGKLDEAVKYSTRARSILEGLRAHGDRSEATAIAFAIASDARASSLFDSGQPGTVEILKGGVAALKPFAESAHPTYRASQTYVTILGDLGYQQLRHYDYAGSLETLALGASVAAAAGGADVNHPDMASEYAFNEAWRMEALDGVGRDEEAHQVAAQIGPIANRLVERWPSNLTALKAQQLIASNEGFALMNEMHVAEAAQAEAIGARASQTLTRLDPGNRVVAYNFGVDHFLASQAHWHLGLVRESIDDLRDARAVFNNPVVDPKTGFVFDVFDTLASSLADSGNTKGALAIAAEAQSRVDALRRSDIAGTPLFDISQCRAEGVAADVAVIDDEPATARSLGAQCLERMRALKPRESSEEQTRNETIFWTDYAVAEAAYLQKDFAEAEQAGRESFAARGRYPLLNDHDRRDQAGVATILAMALAREDKTREAAEVLAPVIKLQRELTGRNHDDQWQHVELASAIYAQSLLDPGRRAVLLAEARRLLGSLPAEMRELRTVRLWQARVAGNDLR